MPFEVTSPFIAERHRLPESAMESGTGPGTIMKVAGVGRRRWPIDRETGMNGDAGADRPTDTLMGLCVSTEICQLRRRPGGAHHVAAAQSSAIASSSGAASLWTHQESSPSPSSANVPCHSSRIALSPAAVVPSTCGTAQCRLSHSTRRAVDRRATTPVGYHAVRDSARGPMQA
jgi:hypothetical protein